MALNVYNNSDKPSFLQKYRDKAKQLYTFPEITDPRVGIGMARRKGKNQVLKAVLELRDMVLGGSIAPGERLSEVSVSEQIGISRTPVREALGRLEHEGLLEQLPTGGYMVRTFTFEDVIDAIELRGVLEGTVARLAAERGVDPGRMAAIRRTLAQLDAVIAAGAAAMDLDAYSELNAEFHEQLAGLAGSETIRREVERAANLPFAAPSAFLEAQSSILEFRLSLIGAQAQHRDMLDAIENREGARAESVAREHARLARKNIEYVMTQDRRLIPKVPGLSLVAG